MKDLRHLRMRKLEIFDQASLGSGRGGLLVKWEVGGEGSYFEERV